MTRILIIDDDPDVRTLIGLVLQKEGYDVDTASCRDEALKKLIQFSPEVVLLDVLLSGSDGRKLCQQIKHDEKTSKTTVIMISAHPGAAEKIESYGADDFITKPVNTGVLLEKIVKFSNS